MKAFIALMFSASLLFAGSATAISNQFSMGKTAGVIRKTNVKPGKLSNVIIINKWNSGVLFEMNGAEQIRSLSIIGTNGRTIKKFKTAGVKSFFWDGYNSYGTRISNGCYLAKVNDLYTVFVLSGRESGK